MLTHPGRYAAPASPLHPGQVLAEVNIYACSFSLRIPRGLFPFQGQRKEIIVKYLLELNPAPAPFSGEYFIVPHNRGVWVRDFSKKYLLSLKIHRFLNLLCPISPHKTYHHPSLTCGYCTFYKAQGTFWPQLKIAIY